MASAHAGFKTYQCRAPRGGSGSRHHPRSKTILINPDNRKVKKIIKGLEEQTDEHYDKVDRDVRHGNQGAARHHISEINVWKERIARLKGRLQR